MVILMDKYNALKKYFGYDCFKSNQEDIVDSLVGGNDTIAILQTGGGKSVCFQIPALLASGITLVITPLISLMQDQVLQLKKRKIKAEYITGEMNLEEIKKVLKNVKNGLVKLLYISPERLENVHFCRFFSDVVISYIIIDEAHCISVWGNDFRPSYMMIKNFINELGYRPVVGAFTATANKHVISDISSALELKNENVFKGSFDRKNLYYSVVSTKHKMSFLLKFLLNTNEVGIIYTLTRKEAFEVYKKLKDLNFSVGIYHGGMDPSEKANSLKLFINEEIKIMVATNAFGMGINKPNIRFVINYSLPMSLEDLSQQSGRCSRDGEEGLCILLFDSDDIASCEYFIKHTKCSDKEIQNKLIKEKYKQLKSVIDYATTTKCLHHYMLNYFDENSKNKCFMCCNCNSKRRK